MGTQNTHWFAGLYQEGFIVFQLLQDLDYGFKAFPAAGCSTSATVNY